MEPTIVVKALGALAQETRLSIFRLLVEYGPAGLAASRIGEALGLAPATLSFHLKELTRAGLITARPDGRFIYYCTDFDAMNALIAYLIDNCCSAVGACEPSRSPLAGPAPARAEAAASAKPMIHAKWRFA